MRNRTGSLIIAALFMIALVLTACSGGAAEKEGPIQVDQQGFTRVQAGIEATTILSAKGLIPDAISAYDRVHPFFNDLMPQLTPKDEALAKEVQETTARIDQGFQEYKAGKSGNFTAETLQQLVSDGATLLDEISRAARAFGFELAAVRSLPTPVVTPTTTATATPSGSPTPTATSTPSSIPTVGSPSPTPTAVR